MIWLWVAIGLALSWAPVGALTMRGLLYIEKVDPSRKKIRKVFHTYDEPYVSEVSWDENDLSFCLILWPIVCVVLPARYVLRGARWVGYRVPELYRRFGDLEVGHPLRYIAGVGPKKGELE